MGDAAGELSDCLHLLRLTQQFLGLPTGLVFRFPIPACVL